MIPIDFKGKVVLVTGGGRGIGLAITRSFAEAGATVVITYTSNDPSEIAKSISDEFGVKVVSYLCPGERSQVVDQVVEKVSKEVGEVDVLVANAGVCQWRDALDLPDDELNWVMQVNLFAPIYMARAFARHWLKLSPTVPDPSATNQERGTRDQKQNLNKRILFVSSISGIVSMVPQKQLSYNASKAGLTMAAKTLAGEWAEYGISVNAVSPGYVKTDMTSKDTPEGQVFPTVWQQRTPVDRFATTKELGDFITLICSDRTAGFLTGSDLVMDGGYTVF